MPSDLYTEVAPKGYSVWAEGFAPVARRAFAFLRANDDGHYSSATKMKLLDLADQVESGTIPDTGTIVYLVEAPSTYDPDTEVKSGGLMGVGLVLDGRVILATHRNVRRQGLGRRLLSTITAYNYPTCAWVHSTNRAGQMLLLDAGFTPTTLNSRGAVRYEVDAAAADEDTPPGGYEDQVTPPGRRGGRASPESPALSEELDGDSVYTRARWESGRRARDARLPSSYLNVDPWREEPYE